MTQPIDDLVTDIEEGRCVAFVGAGFTAAAELPGWDDLLVQLTDVPEVSDEARRHVRAMIELNRPLSADDLDTAAQLLSDDMGRSVFVERLRETMHADPDNETMQRRLQWLREIPFRAIVTTNFDPVLEGRVPSPTVYRELLRPRTWRWWERAFWDQKRGAPVVKLHGDLTTDEGRRQIVLTRRDYRRRLYADSGYMTFLQGLLSTNTVLFMGFGFRDAYLNELRSRILALFDYERTQPPLAYAILADVPQLIRHHFERHEGIKVLSFRAEGGDFSGFDRYLECIWSRTAILPRFAHLFKGRRLLWLDAHPENNADGLAFLRRATGRRGSEDVHEVVQARTAEAALERLRSSESFDLVVTNWGDGDARDDEGRPIPTAVRLLTRMRREDIRAPVIVFSRAFDLTNRKGLALSLGAQDYCFRWESLFCAIDRVLRSGRETG